jgi:hypothetical protein
MLLRSVVFAGLALSCYESGTPVTEKYTQIFAPEIARVFRKK